MEVAPPKYVVIVNAVQQRIEDGTYPPGAMLPSETQLIKEFGVSRPTVVRSLELLRQQGWIEAQHGRGRIVRGRPAAGTRRVSEHTSALLAAVDTADVQVLEAGPVIAPARAAAALQLRAGAAVVARRRLVSVDKVGPVELATAYLPVELAAGTGAGEPAPLPEGLLAHLSARKGAVFDHVVQRISTRRPSAEQARLLQVGRADCLLNMLLTVCDRAGRPVLAVDVLLPSSRHEMEEVFTLT